jgi:hypothetical protein
MYIYRYDLEVDGGYDNPNWPTELDEMVYIYLYSYIKHKNADAGSAA